MVLKIKLNVNQHVSFATINDENVPAYFEDQGFGFLYLPRLQNKKYILKYKIGNDLLPRTVYNDGTYNVYGMSDRQNEIHINVKVYGNQVVKVKCEKPHHVISDNNGLSIENLMYEEQKGILHLGVKAKDIQGEAGNIMLQY